MSNVVEVIGLQWGDEGKGRVACYVSHNAKLVVRATGGNNAGHTVVYNGVKHALHLDPSPASSVKVLSAFWGLEW